MTKPCCPSIVQITALVLAGIWITTLAVFTSPPSLLSPVLPHPHWWSSDGAAWGSWPWQWGRSTGHRPGWQFPAARGAAKGRVAISLYRILSAWTYSRTRGYRAAVLLSEPHTTSIVKCISRYHTYCKCLSSEGWYSGTVTLATQSRNHEIAFAVCMYRV